MSDTPTAPKKTRGIPCRCGGVLEFVIASRRLANGTITRRRECDTCGRRETAVERPAPAPPLPR